MHLSTRISAIVGVAVSALALGACSSTQPTPASSPEASATSETRTVTDASGQEVTLPSHPSRVVTLSEPTTDNALALGVTPIGVVSGRGQQTVPNYLIDRAGDIPILGSIGTPNLEAIGAAHPDLILVDGTSVKNNDTETLTALSQIAPVFFTTQSGGDWRQTFALTADALGLADQAETKLAEFDQHVASVSARLKDAGYLDQTYSVVRWQGDSAGLILKELPAGQALTALGMKRPANQDRDGEGHSEPVSLENIDQIDADWIFFGPVDGSLWTSTGGYLLMDGIVSSIEAQFVPAS